MKLSEIVEEALKAAVGAAEPRSDEHWELVTVLTEPDKERFKVWSDRVSQRRREALILKAQFDALNAAHEKDGHEWWLHLYKQYGLSDAQEYVMKPDGRILTDPRPRMGMRVPPKPELFD